MGKSGKKWRHPNSLQNYKFTESTKIQMVLPPRLGGVRGGYDIRNLVGASTTKNKKELKTKDKRESAKLRRSNGTSFALMTFVLSNYHSASTYVYWRIYSQH